MHIQYILMDSHMSMPKLEKILAFRLKCAKRALSLIMIMDYIHEGKILYKKNFLSNTLLHFPPYHVDEIILESVIGAWQVI